MSKVITDAKQVDEVLTRGVENIYPDKESLRKELLSGRRLRLYCGFDPTAPTLHIGHGIQIRKLEQFRRLGHEVILLIGDFTAQIGDPTGKDKTRKPLTHQQVLENAKGYKKQIGRILDLTQANVRFVHNEKWTNKLKPADMLELASHFTVARLLERDMFQERIKANRDIHLHEFLYPIFQAYDAVTLDVDLQIGGSDQMFNMLCGRTLMKKMKNKEKFVLTTKLLEDPTGKKMGKSEGNTITLNDAPADMYGKIMSWPDTMITTAMEILTDIPLEEIKEAEKEMSQGVNPRDYKMKLAYEVVRIYLGHDEARHGQNEFARVFQEKQKPTDIPTVIIQDKDGQIGVLDLFVQAGLATSNSEVKRLVKEKAIRIDDELITHDTLLVKIPPAGLLLQRGKKQFATAKLK